jgi:hypothetical protein
MRKDFSEKIRKDFTEKQTAGDVRCPVNLRLLIYSTDVE